MKKIFVSASAILLLLTVLASIGYAAPAASMQVPFKGSLHGTENYRVDPPTLYVSGSGSGTATQLGGYTVSYEVVVNLVTTSGPATARFVAANGDTIFAAGHGQATETGTPNVNQIVERYTITGGTGRFDGASGSFTVDRLVNLVTGATSGSFDGTIVTP